MYYGSQQQREEMAEPGNTSCANKFVNSRMCPAGVQVQPIQQTNESALLGFGGGVNGDGFLRSSNFLLSTVTSLNITDQSVQFSLGLHCFQKTVLCEQEQACV